MVSRDKNEEMFDALIKSAINDEFHKEIEALPTNEELNKLYTPSPELDMRIKKLIDKSYRKSKMQSFSKTILKVIACIAICFTLLSAGLLSVEATRNKIFNIIIEWHEKYTKVEFKDSATDSKQSGIYQPSYLPDGFSQTSLKKLGNVDMLVYSNNTGETIIFSQWTYGSGSSSVDNENKKYSEIEISGNKAYLFEAIKEDDSNILTWQAGDMVFELTSSIESKELIHIAESLKNNTLKSY